MLDGGFHMRWWDLGESCDFLLGFAGEGFGFYFMVNVLIELDLILNENLWWGDSGSGAIVVVVVVR